MARPGWGRIVLWVVLGGLILANAAHCVSWFFGLPTPGQPRWVKYAGVSGVALMAIVALAVTLMRRWPRVAALRRFGAAPTDNRHLVAFTIAYAAWTVPKLVESPEALGYFWYSLWCAGGPVALLWMWWCGSFRTTLRRDWGLHSGRSFLVEAGWGLAAYVACWCLWRAFAFGIAGSAAFNPWWMRPTFLFLLLIYAPVVEETFFRGALYRELRRSLRWFGAALVVSVAFTVMHGFLWTWTQVVVLFVHGFVLCVLREWRDSLVAPMVTHLAWNGVPKLLPLLFPDLQI